MEQAAIRIIGVDPGLRNMGWGIVEVLGSRLAYVASGSVHSNPQMPLATRLRELHEGLAGVISEYAPVEAAVEETFVNREGASELSLNLGDGRGQAAAA
jgi:crossover junction endodeoxyribonuclease RuvC